MPWFDNPAIYPKAWSDYPLDFYLHWIYTASVVGLIFFGGAPSIPEQSLVALTVAAILIWISYAYRRRMRWHWPGVRPKEIRAAIIRLLPMPIFALAAIPILPPENRQFFPLYLLWAGIILYLALFYLKISPPSKSVFLQQCSAAASANAVNSAALASPASSDPASAAFAEPRWMIVTRALYRFIYFLAAALWLGRLDLIASMRHHNSSGPTPATPDPIFIDNHLVYIAHYQKVLIVHLPQLPQFTIYIILAVGMLLHFFVGVNLLAPMPTLRQRRQRRANESRLDISGASFPK